MYSEISLPWEATVSFQYIFPDNGIICINKQLIEMGHPGIFFSCFPTQQYIVSILCQ